MAVEKPDATVHQLRLLTPFEGRDVLRSVAKITKAGDGLSSALEMEPVEIALGQRVFVVLEGEVDKVIMAIDADSGAAVRQHVIRTIDATFLDAKQGKELMREYLDRKLEAQAQRSLLTGDGENVSDEAKTAK